MNLIGRGGGGVVFRPFMKSTGMSGLVSSLALWCIPRSLELSHRGVNAVLTALSSKRGSPWGRSIDVESKN